MSYDEDISDLHKRLDDFEKRLAETKVEIGRTRSAPSGNREQIDEIYAKARAIRQKLLETEESTWEAVRHELEADWEALTASFEHVVKHIDEDYRHRGA